MGNYVRQIDNYDADGVLINRELSTVKTVKSEEFIQVYLSDMSGMMNITSKSELRVLVAFWKHSTYIKEEQLGNMVAINSKLMSDISEEIGMNVQSIRNVVVDLKKKNLLIADKQHRGIYYLNPEYFFKGNSKERLKCCTRIVKYQVEEDDSTNLDTGQNNI